MKRLRLILSIALLVTVVPSVVQAAPRPVERLQAAGVGPNIPLRCKGAATRVRAFTVTAEWERPSKVFTRTETAKLVVTVTRPAPEDPLDLGIPLPQAVTIPVEGANVWTSVITGRWPFPYDFDQTDAEGKVYFEVPLTLLRKPGQYPVSHYANMLTNQGGCPDIEEWGYLYDGPGVKIRP